MAIYDFWTMRTSTELLDNWRMEEAAPCFEGDLKISVAADERDPEVLRAALIRETAERRRAECLAKMQADVVQLALDLLVREPDIEGFFGALTKTMVDEATAMRVPCGSSTTTGSSATSG